MKQRVQRWAKSRRGVSSIVLTVFAINAEIEAGTPAPSAIAAVVFLLPLMAGIVAAVALVWEAKTLPAAPRFSRNQTTSSSRQMREDGNAKVFSDRGGFLFEKRYFFVGTGCPPVRLKPDVAVEAARRSQSEPVLVAYSEARRYWWYQGRFAWENQGLGPRDVMALLHERDRRRGRMLSHAHTMLDVEQGLAAAPPRQRQPIPHEVRRAVFTRDGGRCVECQSNFDIQYDHIIPWSMGGADSVENLQLLCSPCNRKKSATL